MKEKAELGHSRLSHSPPTGAKLIGESLYTRDFSGCQIAKGSTVYVNTCVNIRNGVSVMLLEQGRCSYCQNLTLRGGQFGGDMAHARRR